MNDHGTIHLDFIPARVMAQIAAFHAQQLAYWQAHDMPQPPRWTLEDAAYALLSRGIDAAQLDAPAPAEGVAK
jgi:hypothetical protein